MFGCFEDDGAEVIFSHAFIAITWNLVCHFKNTVYINRDHISWHEDALTIIFAPIIWLKFLAHWIGLRWQVVFIGGQAIQEALQIMPTTSVDCRHSNYRILSKLVRALL
jgi:hypothetical protein